VITWDSRTLYEPPVTGICEITGEYETGRFYKLDGTKRIFIGNTAAPDHVEDYARFLAMTGTVAEFKAGYPKTDRIAERFEKKKSRKK